MKGRSVPSLRRLNDVSTGPAVILLEGTEAVAEAWPPVDRLTSGSLQALLDATTARILEAAIFAFAHQPLYLLPLGELKNGLNWLARHVQQTHPEYGAQVVTLNPLYCDDNDQRLDVNRMLRDLPLVDANGTQQYGVVEDLAFASVGPRPGSRPLRDQVASIQQPRNVILVDDVIWKGETASSLYSAGLRVRAVAGGVVREEGRHELQRRGMTVHDLIRASGRANELLDVLPVHDFLPFAPLAGIAIGSGPDDSPQPVIHDGISFCSPICVHT